MIEQYFLHSVPSPQPHHTHTLNIKYLVVSLGFTVQSRPCKAVSDFSATIVGYLLKMR